MEKGKEHLERSYRSKNVHTDTEELSESQANPGILSRKNLSRALNSIEPMPQALVSRVNQSHIEEMEPPIGNKLFNLIKNVICNSVLLNISWLM